MEIIPTINCENLGCVKRRFEIAKDFGVGWVQIDISEKSFCGFESWNNPEDFINEIGVENLNFYIEVHLMVKEPTKLARRWLEAGVDRIIVHIESDFNFDELSLLCQSYGAELMISLFPETPVEEVFPYLSKTNLVQLLAVSPGPSGQDFQKDVIFKINTLLEKAPGVIIEIDGGVDNRIVKKLKEEGINMAAVGSFIFDSPNPVQKYKILKSLA
jgi:ribulose-phosphate 3-epimerase